MSIGQRYNVQQHPISTVLAWIQQGSIAIPEIQRPFVWDAAKVRNLLDSLFQGFPVGYLIGWKNPDVKLKDGTLSSGKLILINGQERHGAHGRVAGTRSRQQELPEDAYSDRVSSDSPPV